MTIVTTRRPESACNAFEGLFPIALLITGCMLLFVTNEHGLVIQSIGHLTEKSNVLVYWNRPLIPYANMYERTIEDPEATVLAFVSVNETELKLVEEWIHAVEPAVSHITTGIAVVLVWNIPRAILHYTSLMSRVAHQPMENSTGDWLIDLPRTAKGWQVLSDLTQPSHLPRKYDVFRDWDLRVAGTQNGWNVWIPHRHWDDYCNKVLVSLSRDEDACNTTVYGVQGPPGDAGPWAYKPPIMPFSP